MIGTEILENAAREIEKTGKLEVVFTIEKEAIDKLGADKIVEVEFEAISLFAWQIIEKYLEMKREGKL